MVEVPSDVEKAEFEYSIRQPFVWRLYKDWEKLGLGLLFMSIPFLMLASAIWVTITEPDLEVYLYLIVSPFLFWWGWWDYWLFKRVHNRFYLKLHAMLLTSTKRDEFAGWIDRTLSTRGMRFSKEFVYRKYIPGGIVKPIYIYTFLDFQFTLSFVDAVWNPAICIGPVTKENLDEIQQLMAYIKNVLEHDRQEAIKLSEEKYEEIGAALTRLWSS